MVLTARKAVFNMEDQEKRRGIRRPEKEEQLARIAEIVEKEKERWGEWAQEFREEYGYSAQIAHSIMLEAKKEGLSTAMVFGYILEDDRKKAGLTQGELGKKVEELGLGRRVSGSMISRFENGERLGEEFPSKTLLSIVAALRAPDNTFWALMEYYEHAWPESSTMLLKIYGQLSLQRSLRRGFVPFDAARYSHRHKGE